MSESPSATVPAGRRRGGSAGSRIARYRAACAARPAPRLLSRRRYWLAALVLVLALVAAFLLDARRALVSGPRALEVIAVDELGQPLRDVAVRFFASRQPTKLAHESRTDEQGLAVLPADKADGEFYCLASLADGTVSLAHVSQRFVKAAIPFETPERITGRVRDSAGKDAAGARVEARLLEDGPSLETCTTDATGTFELRRVSKGLAFLTIRVSHEGHATAEIEWYRKSEAPIEVDLVASPGLRVRITDPAGNPLRGLAVRIATRNDMEAATDDQGLVAFTELGVDRGWHLQIDAGQLPDRTYRAQPFCPGAATQELIVEPPAVIEGHVVSAAGTPLAGIEVRHPHGPRAWVRARTDREGWFRLGDLPSGTTELVVELPDGELLARPVALQRGEHRRGFRLVATRDQ